MQNKKKMILVSACLAGFPCRYDGKKKPNKKIVEMVKNGEAIPVCPEQLGGLATPRIPAEIIENENKEIRVITKNGKDVTRQYLKGAKITLDIVKDYGVSSVVLKAKSPSCGCGKIYDGSYSGTLKDGDGITTRLLKENGITIKTEEDLN